MRGLTPDKRREAAREELASREGLPVEPMTVRISTAVKLTGIGRSTLYELINSGQIETVKVGRSTLVLYRSLKKLIGDF